MLDLQGYGHLLLSGSVVTMKLALTSLVIGLILGLFGAIAKLSRFKVLQAIATAYTTFVRGIPELLSVLFIYFGGTMLLGAILSKFGYTKYVEISQFWAGVMALSFAFGAYATETFRMAFQEIPKGQDEAGQAIGLNRRQILADKNAPNVAVGFTWIGQFVFGIVKRYRFGVGGWAGRYHASSGGRYHIHTKTIYLLYDSDFDVFSDDGGGDRYYHVVRMAQ